MSVCVCAPRESKLRLQTKSYLKRTSVSSVPFSSVVCAVYAFLFPFFFVLMLFVCIVRVQCVARCLSVCHLNQSDQNGMCMGFSSSSSSSRSTLAANTPAAAAATAPLPLSMHCSRSVYNWCALLQPYPHHHCYIVSFVGWLVSHWVHIRVYRHEHTRE